MLDRVTHRAARSCSAQGAASGAVDNPTSARHHLTNAFYCPNNRGHLCERNMTPSEAFRLVVLKLVAKGAVDAPRKVAEGETDGGKIRKEIRLTESEIAQAENLAFKEGFSLSRWIVALVRARLTGTVQLGQQEMELLARSNMQLLALGRNLNQIAKALNTSPEDHRVFKVDVIANLQNAIKEHTTVVASVMAANVERWKIK